VSSDSSSVRPSSHETKVPVLAANQVDLMHHALAETPERKQVVDFVLYSNTSVCLFGRADNRARRGQAVDDLNKPDVTIAYFHRRREEAGSSSASPRRSSSRRQFGATRPLG